MKKILKDKNADRQLTIFEIMLCVTKLGVSDVHRISWRPWTVEHSLKRLTSVTWNSRSPRELPSLNKTDDYKEYFPIYSKIVKKFKPNRSSERFHTDLVLWR